MDAQEVPKPSPAAGPPASTPAGRKEHFRQLRRRLQVGLLVANLVPLAIVTGYLYWQFTRTLQESGKLHLAALAESQRNTIDLFLQERVVNVFNLFRLSGLTPSPTQQDMQAYLMKLREASDAFMDVGFFSAEGIQVGYAGPHPHLRGKDYSREAWFRTLMERDREFYISDIYLGFRQKPHFTIAVRQLIEGRNCVMRAALDPDKFYMFLRSISRGKGVDSSVINAEGRYQVVDPDRGRPLEPSPYRPPADVEAGARELGSDGNSLLVAHAWLKEAPWCLVVRQPLGTAYAELYRTRLVILVGTAALVVVLAAAVRLIVVRLLQRAEAAEESRAELMSQLVHASKLVSVGELAGGVAHEINNPLAIIGSESGVIRDMLDPQFGMECTPDKIRAELDQIDRAVYRARDITRKLLSFVRKQEPHLVRCGLNQLLDEAVAGVKEQEFRVSNIRLVRDYAPDLPDVLADPDQMRQVFLNLLNNAGDAIRGPGAITLTTRREGDMVRATVADTGCGMTSQQMAKLFTPFYTTKEEGKGTGLGLPISLSIVEALGGRIDVQSMPGAGSSFAVVLPLATAKD